MALPRLADADGILAGQVVHGSELLGLVEYSVRVRLRTAFVAGGDALLVLEHAADLDLDARPSRFLTLATTSRRPSGRIRSWSPVQVTEIWAG